MITYALGLAMVCFGLGLILNLWRLAIGPTVADRVLALDTMVVNVIAIIVLFGIQTGQGINFEAAMLFALTGFVGTVAFCKYLLRGSVIE
ncbi:K+/H+ antiporter subunit F [Paragemmobacter ruber]|uniref:K+/H+ antiporter subunit F n=1 Tax=Paragemmobacter ruber TaxID=1985673 RepID=A0ABW9Y750_9RHOB|nr:K+/H+ antiporter subunit F [Rhodobacter ruber]NBE07669.1 K+/H+ antiporter subunit F [Rhodobacter ruber]